MVREKDWDNINDLLLLFAELDRFTLGVTVFHLESSGLNPCYLRISIFSLPYKKCEKR